MQNGPVKLIRKFKPTYKVVKKKPLNIPKEIANDIIDKRIADHLNNIF